jgi:hypothetical protein
VIIPFDQGETCKPVTFKMRPAFVTRAGSRYARHTPEPEQLKGTGLKVAEEQPADNSPNGNETVSADNSAPEAPRAPNRGQGTWGA